MTEKEHADQVREKDNLQYTIWEREAKSKAKARRKAKREHRPVRDEVKA
jgi:hypothetical protein